MDRYFPTTIVSVGLLILAAWFQPAGAQPTYSIDWQSPTKGLADSIFGAAITEGDLLTFPPGPPPGILMIAGPPFFPAPGIGIPAYPGAVGLPAGVPGGVELDALSFGRDFLLDPSGTPHIWFSSVDEFAIGVPGVPGPSVTTEGAAGFGEASADIFSDFPPGFFNFPYPQAPGASGPFSTAVFDGNGIFPWGGPPLGLIEPNPPTVPPPFPAVPDPGDNLDALDIDTPVPLGGTGIYPVYFSLDSALFDPAEMIANSGSAAANAPALGFPFGSGADIWVTPGPGVPPVLFAPAAALGLDMLGVDTDDVDALVLAENGDGFYTPSITPFDWLGGGTDMLFFSVRRGSAVIGMPDSNFGVPIEEGDILIPPPAFLPPGAPPGIWIAAENLGLATLRSGTAGFPFGDDLNALDLVADCNMNGIPDGVDIDTGMASDCNGNLVPDICDIAAGTSLDCNTNGIPDECETDCNMNGIPDSCDIAAGTSLDCNMNGIPDECDVGPGGVSIDGNMNGIPDECEADCNMNGVPDSTDIASGTSLDCNMNSIPDECDVAPGGVSADVNMNGIPDECELDCNMNGVPDSADIASGTSLDCNMNGIPDECDVSAAGTSADCNMNGIPDECEPDCNMNGVADSCDITAGTSLDCNMNGIPDECDVSAVGTSADCNMNGIPDECEPDCNMNGVADSCDIAVGTSLDCNMNGIPDECDVSAVGTSADCNMNGIPDECEPDCNMNGVADSCDITAGTSLDCNMNGIPDECDVVPGGASADCNTNGIPDECETDCNSNGVPDDCDISTGTSLDANSNGIPDECEGANRFIRGDCNGDGSYDIADAVTILAFLFSMGAPPTCEDACDCNDDGLLNIADSICILGGLFGMTTTPPPAPHPGCGLDPTPGDPLRCVSFPPCP